MNYFTIIILIVFLISCGKTGDLTPPTKQTKTSTEKSQTNKLESKY